MPIGPIKRAETSSPQAAAQGLSSLAPGIAESADRALRCRRPDHGHRQLDTAASFVLTVLPPPPARVLEVGCGAGDLARALDGAGLKVLAIDPEAPEGPIFRRTTLEELEPTEPYDAAVARYSLHHIENLNSALDKISSLLLPRGRLVIEEFGWDRFDRSTAEWYGREQGTSSVDSALAEWRREHEGLHSYEAMRLALDARFSEQLFEWRPYLYRCLERDELEANEREAISEGQIQAVGFRYVGLRS